MASFRVFVLAAAFAATGAAAAAAQVICPAAPPPMFQCGNPEFQSCGIMVNGVPRHFCIHVPQFPASDVPVVWGFHGHTGSAARAVNWLQDQTEQGMVLVAPSALPSEPDCTTRWRHMNPGIRIWADFGLVDNCTPPAVATAKTADLDFVTALLDEIDSRLEVAGHYALGFSSGAGMVLQMMFTAPLSTRFEGWGVIANGMNTFKVAGAANGGFGPYSADTETKRPVIVQTGTADKVQFPADVVIETLNFYLVQAGDPCGLTMGNITIEAVILCFVSKKMAPGLGKNDYRDQAYTTREWLVERMNANPRPIESLYPDIGHAAGVDPAQQDQTATVRRDYVKRGEDSAPVTILTTIDGAHNVPGSNGNYPPCSAANCDIDMVREILQFWRANAGLHSLWR
jgi:poly(3-hydroxybutyrate) depolymerase